MADIIKGERIKKILRKLLQFGYKLLKTDMQMVGEDLIHDQNPVVRNLNTIILIGANHLHQRDNWQKNMTLGYSQAALWLIQKDTAYRDVFFWTFNEILKHADEFKKMLKPYVKPPEEWIPNLWENSRLKSEKKRNSGDIPKGGKCLEETIFTPQIQDQRHKKLLKQK